LKFKYEFGVSDRNNHIPAKIRITPNPIIILFLALWTDFMKPEVKLGIYIPIIKKGRPLPTAKNNTISNCDPSGSRSISDHTSTKIPEAQGAAIIAYIVPIRKLDRKGFSFSKIL
jgi:hypothetical protein